MNDFDQLLGELATLTKAATADSKVMAAAREGGAPMPDMSKPAMTEEEEEAERERMMMKGEEDGDDGMMGKSFSVTLADGTVQDAFDGTKMLKAMGVQVASLAADRDAARSDLTKALSASTVLVGLVKQQGELVKALHTRVEAMANTGRGRQATVSLADKPGLIGGAGAGAATNGQDIMAKAMTAFQAGKLDGSDVSRIESHLGRGSPVPADILERLA